MATANEKVSKFLSAITSYAEQQRHTILDEIEAYKKEELDKVESETLRSAYQLIQKETAEMRAKISREISNREMTGRRALLEQRQKIMEKVFERAREDLISFAQSDLYPSYMEKSVKEISAILTGENTVLYVKKDDLVLRERLHRVFGRTCTVEADETIFIGGIKGMNPDMNLVADNSLDEKLHEQQEWFAQHSGLSISPVLPRTECREQS